jgi:ATP-dependent Lon protease
LQDIPENVKNHIEVVPVKWIDKVLEVALAGTPQPLPDEEAAAAPKGSAPAAAAAPGPDAGGEAIKH